jgi:hypothetical protein
MKSTKKLNKTSQERYIKTEPNEKSPQNYLQCKTLRNSRRIEISPRQTFYDRKMKTGVDSGKDKSRHKSRSKMRSKEFRDLNLFNQIIEKKIPSRNEEYLNSFAKTKKKSSNTLGMKSKRFSINKRKIDRSSSLLTMESELETKTIKFEQTLRKSSKAKSKKNVYFTKKIRSSSKLAHLKKNDEYSLRVNLSNKTIRASRRRKTLLSPNFSTNSRIVESKTGNPILMDKKLIISILFLQKKFDVQKLKAFLKIKFTNININNFMKKKFRIIAEAEQSQNRDRVVKRLLALFQKKFVQKIKLSVLKLKLNRLRKQREQTKEYNPLITLGKVIHNLFTRKLKTSFKALVKYGDMSTSRILRKQKDEGCSIFTENFLTDAEEKKSMKSTHCAVNTQEQSYFINGRKKSLQTAEMPTQITLEKKSSKSFFISTRDQLEKMSAKSRTHIFEDILEGICKLQNVQNSIKKNALE